jgi:hypothetical protein
VIFFDDDDYMLNGIRHVLPRIMPRFALVALVYRQIRLVPLQPGVGIRTAPPEGCSGFTHITGGQIAQQPKATFVTRLQPGQLPAEPLVGWQINRQHSGWIPPPQVIRDFGARAAIIAT